MSLKKYREKRKFNKTPEPKGKIVIERKRGPLRFVVQEHRARNLHWDFRLEMAGVLKSWALPKKPPQRPGIKRLAMRTEDHPLDYINFEGEIPKGEYGAGKIKIWDKGTYDFEREINMFHLPREILLNLRGSKLKGKYVLLKPKGSRFGKGAWLFFKLKVKNKK